MNINNLPTDSLYKFCSLAGTFIILFSNYLLWNSQQETIKQINEYSLRKAIIEVEAEFLKDQVNELKELNDYLNTKKKRIQKLETELKLGLNEQFEKSKQLRIRIAELEVIGGNTVRLNRNHNIFLALFSISSGAGFILALWGYINWYRRIQKYQDIIIKQNAKRENNKLGTDS